MDWEPCRYKNNTYFPEEIDVHVRSVKVLVKHDDASSIDNYCEQNW